MGEKDFLTSSSLESMIFGHKSEDFEKRCIVTTSLKKS
jgi:hypothetical protein